MCKGLMKLFKWFDLSELYSMIESKTLHLESLLVESNQLTQELRESIVKYEDSYQKYVKKQLIVASLEKCSNAMQWAKDLNGRYLYANAAIKEGLLFTENPIGLTDMEIAEGIRLEVGEDKHTAGETCYGSDLEVVHHRKTMRFIEKFNLQTGELILEVVKSPMFDEDNKMIGVAGVGVDITRRYNLVNRMFKAVTPDIIGQQLHKELKHELEIYNV